MARNQKNFKYQKYVDDNGTNWSLMSETGGAMDGIDGHATFDAANPVFGRTTVRRHPRYAIFQDPVTLRTVKGVIFTAAAYADVNLGDTIAVQVAGLATTVTYNYAGKVGEKIPVAKASQNHPDS